MTILTTLVLLVLVFALNRHFTEQENLRDEVAALRLRVAMLDNRAAVASLKVTLSNIRHRDDELLASLLLG